MIFEKRVLLVVIGFVAVLPHEANSLNLRLSHRQLAQQWAEGLNTGVYELKDSNDDVIFSAVQDAKYLKLLTTGADFEGALTAGGLLTVEGGGAAITGNTAITADAAVPDDGDLDVAGTLTAGGLLTVEGGGAAITGDTTITADGVDSAGNLNVAGTLTAGDQLTVSGGGAAITGSSVITAPADASGSIQLKSGTGTVLINNDGDLTVPGTLSVAAVTTAGASGLTVSGDLTVIGKIVHDDGTSRRLLVSYEEHDSLKNGHEDLEKKYEDLKGEHKDLKGEHEDLKGEHKDLKDEHEDLKKELKELKSWIFHMAIKDHVDYDF